MEWHRLLASVESVTPPPRFIVGSGGLALGVPDDFWVRVAAICRRVGARFILDTYGPSLRRAMGSGIYLAKPNQREFGELIGQTLEDPREIATAARGLVAEGKAEFIVVTLGEMGAVMAGAEGAWYAHPMSIKVNSAVGAGDSFMGSMIAALAKGKTPLESFRYGNAGGAATLMRTGTELCHSEDVELLLPQIKIDAIG